MRLRPLAAALLALGVLLLLAGAIVGSPAAVGLPSLAPGGLTYDAPPGLALPEIARGHAALSPRDGNTLMGAGLAFLVGGLLAAVAERLRRRPSAVWWPAASLGALGVGLVAAGAIVGPPLGDPAFLVLFGAKGVVGDLARATTAHGALSPADGNTLLGAGVALLLAAGAWAVAEVRRRPEPLRLPRR